MHAIIPARHSIVCWKRRDRQASENRREVEDEKDARSQTVVVSVGRKKRSSLKLCGGQTTI